MFCGTNLTLSSGVDQDTYGKETQGNTTHKRNLISFTQIALAMFLFYTSSHFYVRLTCRMENSVDADQLAS